MKRVVAILSAVVLLTALIGPAATVAAKPAHARAPEIRTNRDQAKEKIHPRLLARMATGSNANIYVFATVVGDPTAAKKLLAGSRAATSPNGKASIVVGKVRLQQLTKLASTKGVVAVSPVELKKTGSPLGSPDPDVTRNVTNAALQGVFKQLLGNEVPYSAAPPLKESNLEELTELALLDARTHRFAEAWQAGYTGSGSVVSVLDGGTDWGHPDMIGTWQTRATTGWPNAFDPFGTLVLLVQPGNVDLGLTWYTKTEAKSIFTQTVQDKAKGIARVTYAVRTGPSRNFAAPDGFATHDYSFPLAWTKSGTVRLGGHPDDHLLGLFGERAAFIVVDPTTAGVYDTVYVDLDNDHSFVDEKPVTRESPASYRDMNGDGVTDISGGLLYYISNGTGASGAALPGGPGSFGLVIKDVPGGRLAWTGDFDPAIGGHGTLTASNVVGQGVVNGLAPTFADVPGGTPPGMVIGGAPHAKLAPMGDIYFSFDFSTQFAYFLTQAQPAHSAIDITSNSYGKSDADNDGFDAASQEADLWNVAFGVRTLMVGSTGNGAPGYGTTNAPSPVTGMSVGASTQFGGTGWDSIKNHSQIRDNDVIAWSDRGPGATGANAVDVVADGAYSAGDATLNTVLNGNTAWTTWGGTSRSTPVAAGAAALVYQAWRQANGATTPPGFALQARDIIKSSAKDLGYDAWTQGAGSVDAFAAVNVAAGASGAVVTPSEWRPGDYRGDEFDVFPRVLAAGESDSQTFELDGSGTYQLSDRVLSKVDSETLSLTTAPISKESVHNFNVPEYLIDISDLVAAHPGADMIAISANYPYSEFDPNGDYAYDQRWRLLAFDWTDINGDGNLWTDKDGDGSVDHKDYNKSSNIDGNADVKWDSTEIDQYEYVRFSYNGPATNGLRIHVGDPAERMTDGMFIGFAHPERSQAIPVTHFSITVDFYDNVDWGWVSTPASASGSFDATIEVPDGTPAGMYQGAVVASRDGHDIAIPVSVTVATEAPQDAEGNFTGSMTFGGADVAADQANLPYNNGAVFGATDWNWRAESGDWRFFYYDVANEPTSGSLFLVETTWQDEAPYTDLDTLIFGRSENHYQLMDDGAFGAPYILDTVGGSPNTNLGGGVWAFDTASGGAQDIVTGPAQEGLHAIALHQVGWNGSAFSVPFETTVGSATVDPAAVDLATATDSGSFDVTFEAGIDLDGLTADAFGLSQPVTTTETAHQDNPADPSSASVKKPFTLAHAARATITTALTDDLDLFIVYDANNDGTFELSEIIASSAGADGNESVTMIAPPDGNYQAWVQGFAVAGTPTFPLTIDAVQGTDLTVSGLPAGALPAGTPVTITVNFSKPMTTGQDYFGELQLGPPTAPNALSVPITIHRQ
ncbi:MAG TPA: S8 family serine peptidase [Candidatus Limnocylindrales bacterium]|nr:S8 family serine peptidase [Candidatus Limnocylindrales bacterium]